MEKYNELPSWINNNYKKHYLIQNNSIRLQKMHNLSEEVAKRIYENSKKFYSYDSTMDDYNLEKKALKIIFFVLFLIIGYMLSIHNFQLLRLILNLID